MTVRISPRVTRSDYPRWRRRYWWTAYAYRGDTFIGRADGLTWTRRGANVALGRAADRLRRTHGGDA